MTLIATVDHYAECKTMKKRIKIEDRVRILQAVDKIATAFDKAEKDHAADKLLHDRHEEWLEKLEAKVGSK